MKYDPKKNQINIDEHGYSLLDAKRFITDWEEESRHSRRGEDRWVAHGTIDGKEATFVYEQLRNGDIRAISLYANTPKGQKGAVYDPYAGYSWEEETDYQLPEDKGDGYWRSAGDGRAVRRYGLLAMIRNTTGGRSGFRILQRSFLANGIPLPLQTVLIRDSLLALGEKVQKPDKQ